MRRRTNLKPPSPANQQPLFAIWAWWKDPTRRFESRSDRTCVLGFSLFRRRPDPQHRRAVSADSEPPSSPCRSIPAPPPSSRTRSSHTTLFRPNTPLSPSKRHNPLRFPLTQNAHFRKKKRSLLGKTTRNEIIMKMKEEGERWGKRERVWIAIYKNVVCSWGLGFRDLEMDPTVEIRSDAGKAKEVTRIAEVTKWSLRVPKNSGSAIHLFLI